jgi:hypothetical protein
MVDLQATLAARKLLFSNCFSGRRCLGRVAGNGRVDH